MDNIRIQGYKSFKNLSVQQHLNGEKYLERRAATMKLVMFNEWVEKLLQ